MCIDKTERGTGKMKVDSYVVLNDVIVLACPDRGNARVVVW